MSRIKYFIGATFIACLTGCASVEPSAGLNDFAGIQLEPGIYGSKVVTGVEFSYPVPAQQSKDMAFCVAQNVSSNEISVKDTSKSHYGAYTGKRYEVESQRNIAGGSVISYVSSDGKAVSAEGNAKYHEKVLTAVEKAIRFKLAAEIKGNTATYTFSSLEVAQLNTSIVENDGYQPLGAHKHANPELALGVLKLISSKIHRCL